MREWISTRRLTLLPLVAAALCGGPRAEAAPQAPASKAAPARFPRDGQQPVLTRRGEMPPPGFPYEVYADGEALLVETKVAIRPGPGGRQMVILGKPVGPKAPGFHGKYQLGILAREIVRQAFLMAARDGLGLTTRDDSLGDPEGAAVGGDSAASFTTLFPTDAPGKLVVTSGKGANLLSRDLAKLRFGPHSYRDLVTSAEALSASDLPGLLTSLGAKGQAAPAKADGKVPAEAERLLARVDDFAPFAAIRALHESIRRDGESPAKLGALARAYAVLGILSEPQYNPSSKVYKARALLYAQRMVRTAPKSADALRQRAFAEALAGLHLVAREDLAAAAKLAGPGEPAPSWLPILEGFLDFDLKRMQPAGPQHPDAPLAALLRLQTAEYPSRLVRAADAARELSEAEPGCWLAYHSLDASRQIQAQHEGTVGGLVLFDQFGLPRLREVPGLPAKLASAVRSARSIDRAAVALRDPKLSADDAGEPSSAAIARAIGDIRLVQVADRLNFVQRQLAAPTDGDAAELMPLLAGHRHLTAFSSFMKRPRPRDLVRDMLEGFDLDNFEPKYYLLFSIGINTKPRTSVFQLAEAHLDPLVQDIAGYFDIQPLMNHNLAAALYFFNPKSPYAAANLIQSKVSLADQLAPGWLQDPKTDPIILRALANRAIAEKNGPAAIAALERLLKAEPNAKNALRLAEIYEQLGRKADAETLLLASQDLRDEGLDQARIGVSLARMMMARDEYRNARPYAERAAQSYSSWSLLCLIDCYMGLGLWDEALDLIRKNDERYRADPLIELRFCLWTGRGDRARAIADARTKAAKIVKVPESLPLRAEAAALTGDVPQAVALYKSTTPIPGGPPAGIAAGVLADQVGDKALRDQVFDRILKAEKDAPTLRALSLIFEALKGPDPIRLDLKAFDEALKAAKRDGRLLMTLVGGRILAQHGRFNDARPYLETAANAYRLPLYLRCLASETLRANGVNFAPRPVETP